MENYSQKVEYAKEMSVEIERVKEAFLRENYLKKLYEITGFDMSQRTVKPKTVLRNISKNIQFRYGEAAEYEILGQMLLSRQAVNVFKNDLGFLIHPVCNQLALYLINEYRLSDTIQAADLLNQIKEEEVKKLLIDLCEWELAPKAFNMEVLKDAIRKIHDKCIEAKIKEMSELAKKMSNPLDKARLMNEIIELRRKSSQL